MGALDALTFDINLNTAQFEQGAHNVEAILQQLLGGAFHNLAASVEGISQNLLGVTNAGGQMSTALTTGGDAAALALQNVQNATRNVETQTQATSVKVESLWIRAAKRIEFSMRQAMRSFIGPMAAVFGISSMFNQYTGTADRLGKLSESMDINLADLQGWSEAAIRAGGSAEGFQGSLRSLNRQLQMMTATTGKKGKKDGAAAGGMMGGGLGNLLKELKINAKENGKTKDVFQLLTEIAGGAEKMDKQVFAGLAMRSHIDQGTIQLLQKGRAEVERIVERQKLLGGYTKEDAKIAAEFKGAIADLTQVFKMFAAIIMRTVTPVLSAVANAMVSLFAVINQNKEIVTWFVYIVLGHLASVVIPKLLAGITLLKTNVLSLGALALKKAAELTLTIISSLWQIRLGVHGLTMALGTLWATLWPILTAVAGVFIVEDIVSYFNGKASLIGTLIYKFKEIGKDFEKWVDETDKWLRQKAQDFIKWLTDLMPSGLRKLLGIEVDEKTGMPVVKEATDAKLLKEPEKRRIGRAALEAGGTITTLQEKVESDVEDNPDSVVKKKNVEKKTTNEKDRGILPGQVAANINAAVLKTLSGITPKKEQEQPSVVAAATSAPPLDLLQQLVEGVKVIASHDAEDAINQTITNTQNVKADMVVNNTQNITTNDGESFASAFLNGVKKTGKKALEGMIVWKESGQNGYNGPVFSDLKSGT